MLLRPLSLWICCILIWSCQKTPAPSSQSSTTLPFSALEWQSQKTWQSQSQMGKYSLYIYWATWCSACQAELPDLIRLRQEIPESKLGILSVNLDEDPQKALPAYLQKKSFPFLILMPSSSMQTSIGIPSSMPTMVLLDPKGRPVQKWTGAQPYPGFKSELSGLIGIE